jgi:PBP1b-binding outer membrane lipoprotein LpoB
MRARHLALALAAIALLLTACGGPTDTTNAPADTTNAPASPGPTPTDLAHLRKLVDGAESAASSAESDMARE